MHYESVSVSKDLLVRLYAYTYIQEMYIYIRLCAMIVKYECYRSE